MSDGIPRRVIDPVPRRVAAKLSTGIAELAARQGTGLRNLWRAALGLEHVILSDLLTEGEESEVLEILGPGERRTCQDTFCALETMIENSFAEMALGGGAALLQRPDAITEGYLTRYEELARGEAVLAGITAADRVLFVGSGPFPITAVEYARQTGCRVDCVDCLPEAVETSRTVLQRLGLGETVRPRLARGENSSASDYSVVMIGVLARPKQEIFARMEATAPDGCRILARTTLGLRRLIYQPLDADEGLLPRLRRAGVRVATGDQVISAVLYRIGDQGQASGR